jgi:phosphoribosylformylglycinamidine synthase
MATIALKNEGDELLLFGAERGHLGQSLYQELATGRNQGAPPPVDLDAERRTGDLVRGLIGRGAVNAVHDVSDGGLLVAIAEMALAGGLGAELAAAPDSLPAHAIWFGEDQGRYVATVPPGKADAVRKEAARANVPVRLLGKAAGDALKLSGEAPLSLHALRAAHRTWLPRFMAGT